MCSGLERSLAEQGVVLLPTHDAVACDLNTFMVIHRWWS